MLESCPASRIGNTCERKEACSHSGIWFFPDVTNEHVPTMPINRPKFRKAHKTVIAHERWFRKGSPFLGKPFTVKKTVERHATVIKILSRARKRAARAGNDELARCLPPAPGQIDGLPSTPALRLIRLPQMRTSLPAGQGRGRTDGHRRTRPRPAPTSTWSL